MYFFYMNFISLAGLKCAVDMVIQPNLKSDEAGILFLLINLFGRRICLVRIEQRCDKSNRYAMPLERSIEVCISLKSNWALCF